ncbi:MAG TPA: cobalt-precorrin-6A reductase [Acidimicrobiales bacterium]|nr:cobalt-precorrin-6A reductase [Acidimicrobiales bacterium]
MAARRLLLLGGTAEASAIARALAGDPAWAVTTSLAGRTSSPRRPPGELRVGGFGGPAGLAAALGAGGYDVLVDATHPFAARMRWHAAEAAAAVGVPRLRVERPGWAEGPGDRWRRVPDLAAAAGAVAAGPWAKVALTVGRTELAAFAAAGRPGRSWVVRSIEPPAEVPPGPVEVVLGRGPFDRAAERALLADHAVDLLVTKDSGGPDGKLAAARALGLDVLVVDRPPSPPGPLARDVAGALAWLAGLVGRSSGPGAQAAAR